MSTVDRARVLASYRRHISLGRARLAEMSGGLIEVSSAGAAVWDSDGNEYLDCGGYGVFILGHRHPRVVEAVIDQLRRHPMATRLLLDPTAAHAAEALASVTPPGLEYVHFVNSGAEATEAAIKLARANGKRNLIATAGGYHGKTMGALSLTMRDTFQAPFHPLLPQVSSVPFGDAAALAERLAVVPDCCVVIEPIQGEGGVVIPPAGYLRQVQQLCREHDALLVLDEIQTGLGRLGAWWGADREQLSPDILLVGKNLSGGVVPVAAMVATPAVYAPFSRDPFLHTSTFAAAPIAMAAAAAAIRVIEDEDIIARSRDLGAQILAGLREILLPKAGHLVREIRGAGLLIGIELVSEHVAGDLMMELAERHILVNHSLNSNRIVRLTPPAVLNQADIDRLLDQFDSAATAVAVRHPSTTSMERIS